MENTEWNLLRTQAKLLVEKDISPEVEDKFHLVNFFLVNKNLVLGAYYKVCQSEVYGEREQLNPPDDNGSIYGLGSLGVALSAPATSSFQSHTLRWENLFALPPYYYEDLVRKFYANTEAKTKTTNIIWSVVRGKQIGITTKDINEALDVPNEGLSVMYKKSFLPPECTDWKVPDATDRFGVTYTPSQQTNKMILLTSSFTAAQHLVLYLLGTNVLPRASGTNEVRTSDLYFPDKMVHDLNGLIGIDYESVIINHIWYFLQNKSPKHAIPYPRLLSLVIEKLGVDTSTATRTSIKESDKLHRATCGKMGIDFDHLDGTSPPPISGDEAETSRASRASNTPSLLRCVLASQEAILAELQNVNKRLDESDAHFDRMEAHFGIRPPSPPPDAPV
ncbi:hypothetical protein OROHE_024723 [Orobanche hederae]